MQILNLTYKRKTKKQLDFSLCLFVSPFTTKPTTTTTKKR